MPTTDQILYWITAGLTVLLLGFAIFKIAVVRNYTNWVCLFAAFCIATKAIGQLIYLYILWANCIPRYFITFFFLNAAKISLYVLHEQRLSVFFVSQPAAANKGLIFRVVFFILFFSYCANAVAQTVVSCRDCYTTSTGGLTVTSQMATNIKLAHYSIEMTMGLLLLTGNIVALFGLMSANRRAGVNSSSVYSVVLGSDALRFLAVLPVEIYKLSVSYDASGNSGIFPYGSGNGNSGFQQLLDAYKVSILLVLLHFPSAYAKLKSKGSNSKGQSSGLATSHAKTGPQDLSRTDSTKQGKQSGLSMSDFGNRSQQVSLNLLKDVHEGYLGKRGT
ncbi:hypothetical protein HK405_007253 [Cladochytrium tenue]|nr:hypothetical protein HK405_007253 [Cladochytrium tenue]